MPTAAFADPTYRFAREKVNDAISWTNDICSLRRDIACGDRNNLVIVLRQAHGLSWRDAVHRAVDMVHRVTADYQHAEAALRASPTGPAVDDSLTCLADWIAGSLAWHLWSPRYRH